MSMQNLTFEHGITIIATIILVALVGVYSARQVKSSSDFATAGRRAGWQIVAGTILGTFVGGACTVGSAQMAYQYGLSAWWYTIGAGFGCLGLGVIFGKRLWESNAKTVPEILSFEFGGTARLCSSIIVTLALFVNIIPQVLSAIALLLSMFKITAAFATIIGVGLMIVYVVFGGIWGAGLAGLTKVLLILGSVSVVGGVVFTQAGGVSGFQNMHPAFPWYSLAGTKGLASGVAGAMSAIIGIMSTQTYIQAIMSAKGVRTGRLGAIASFIVIPCVGFISTMIGLYMRHQFPDIEPATAFPMFVLTFINPWFGGVILATLLISVVGTGAGVTLGISTILSNDIFKKYLKPDATDKQVLAMSRILIVVVLMATVAFISDNLKSSILGWSILSMGLRGTAAFLPLIAALFLKGRIYRPAGIAAMILGPAAVLGWNIILPKSTFDPLYVGLAVGVVCIVAGLLKGKEKEALTIGRQMS